MIVCVRGRGVTLPLMYLNTVTFISTHASPIIKLHLPTLGRCLSNRRNKFLLKKPLLGIWKDSKETEQNYQDTQVLKMHKKFSRKSREIDKLLEIPRRRLEDIIKIGFTGIWCEYVAEFNYLRVWYNGRLPWNR